MKSNLEQRRLCLDSIGCVSTRTLVLIDTEIIRRRLIQVFDNGILGNLKIEKHLKLWKYSLSDANNETIPSFGKYKVSRG